MAEITTTQAFSDGDTVTATKLNNITANAAIQTDAITNRSAETTVDQANDLLLMYDASATALKKISLSNVIKAGTASNFPVTGNATIGGTLGVTGAITASSTVNGTTIPTSKTLVTTDDTQTLTGKTVNLSSNTLSGTLAQFNTACSDADFASLAGSETLTNKTLTSPAINTGTISGGTINNAVIGGTTAAAGSFTTLSATSPITTQAGTAAAPAIVPTGDTNTGIFFPAADTIAFSEGGTESMRIDSSGNVGVGVTPSTWGTSEYKAIQVGIGGSISGRVSSGDQDKVNVAANVYHDGSVFKYIASDDATIYQQTGGLHIFSNAPSGTAGNTATFTERLRIDSSGRVGIGTSSPSESLEVAGSAPKIKISATSNSSVQLLFNSNASGVQKDTGSIYYLNNEAMTFQTQGTERLRIDSSGRVGIGTTSPAYKFVVSEGGAQGFEFQTSSSTQVDLLSYNRATSLYTDCKISTNNLIVSTGTSSASERLRITGGGAVGIYTPAGTNVLTLESASSGGTTVQLIRGINSSSGNFSGGAASFVVFTNGNVQNTNNSYGSLSDIKLKENIENASSQWNDIKSLQVRKFSFKDDQEHKLMLGLVAQEVELISPNLVETTNDTDKDGNDLGTTTKGVKYSVLYMKAVKALQEAMERIEQLETKVAILEAA